MLADNSTGFFGAMDAFGFLLLLQRLIRAASYASQFNYVSVTLRSRVNRQLQIVWFECRPNVCRRVCVCARASECAGVVVVAVILSWERQHKRCLFIENGIHFLLMWRLFLSLNVAVMNCLRTQSDTMNPCTRNRDRTYWVPVSQPFGVRVRSS